MQLSLNRYGIALSLAGLLFGAGYARAEGETIIRLTHNTLRYYSGTTEIKPKEGDGKIKLESSGYRTFPSSPLDLELGIWTHGLAIYAYPSSNGGSIWVGKAINDTLEIGGTLGLNYSKEKEDETETENDTKSIGAYVYYGQKLGDMTLEINVNPLFTMESTKTPADGSDPAAEIEGSGFTLNLDVVAVFPLAKNFEYAGGFDYSYSSGESKTKPGDIKTTITTSEFGLVLARFRYFI